MLIIIEGLNGVGKTTLAKSLSEKLDIPVFRPFRVNHDVHWGGDARPTRTEMFMAKMGVPVNSYHEDFFAADFFSTFPRVDAVLDRSMPSAVGYGLVDGSVDSEKSARLMLDWWFDQLSSRDDVRYIYMGCSALKMQERAGDRAQSAAAGLVIDKMMIEAWQAAKVHFKSMRLDTAEMSLAEVLDAALKFI